VPKKITSFFVRCFLLKFLLYYRTYLGNSEYIEGQIRRDGAGLRYILDKPVEVQHWKKTNAQPPNTKHGKLEYVDAASHLGKKAVQS
jgi:hypothetical protein